MQQLTETISRWLEDIDEQLPADWAMLPDIGLYMDQVQTLIDRQLGLYQHEKADRLLTSAMINNYIKDGLLPRASSKKYSPVHLALLTMVATLKQVLSMQHLNLLLAVYREPADVARLYSLFVDVQKECLLDSAGKVLARTRVLEEASGEAAAQSEQARAMRIMALELSIEARVKILLAEKVLAALDQEDKAADDETKNNDSRKKEKNH
jgi:hypothetical protein